MAITGNKVVLNLAGADNMKHVEPDDFIIHLRSFQGGIEHSRYSGKVSNAYTVLAPMPGLDPRYFRWVLKAPGFIQELNHTTEQLRDGQSIKFDQFAKIGLPLPPPEEQRRIADFLDDQVALIGETAAKCHRQIELMRELALARIDEMVTGTYGPPRPGSSGPQSRNSAPVRRRIRLKHLAAIPITNGLGLPGEHDDPDWPRYIRTTDIASPVKLRTDTFASQPPYLAQAAMVRQGDILMTAAGATIGKSIRLTEAIRACYAGFLVRFRPNEKVDGRFISLWMQSSDYWSQVDRGAVRSTIDNFSASKYRNLLVPVPPLQEQISIADHLEDWMGNVNQMTDKHLEQVQLLGQLRGSLITAAVTGDLDVTTARRGTPA